LPRDALHPVRTKITKITKAPGRRGRNDDSPDEKEGRWR
jgi:hypothetical protein